MGKTATEIRAILSVENGATADQTGAEIVTLLEALVAGSRLDHGAGLKGLTDDDHTQYQKESEKGAASGYASLNASSKVIQDPTNATATPTASKMPIADGSGKLDGWITAALVSKTLEATRDMEAASGNVAYTGIGFEPTVLIVHAITIDTPTASWGLCDSALAEICTILTHATVMTQGAFLIFLRTAGSTQQSAVVASFDADGFTLTWTKTGTPAAGTGYLKVLALR